jgi:hypothetical protein
MVISGGPPCQGMSGFNRNKRDKDIFGCPKNRIIEVCSAGLRSSKQLQSCAHVEWRIMRLLASSEMRHL